jgi:hemoglobin-like flavoprotein
MTPQQIALVQHSWEQVFPIRETAATMFYARLFELDPGLRPLFKSDIAAQAAKLFDTLNAVVAQLGEAEASSRVAAALGRSHARYGATAANYDSVCSALMWTLQASLGSLFTADVHAAWEAAYARLAAAMRAGACAA